MTARCDVVAIDKPKVFKDDYGWRCEQDVGCLKCREVWVNYLADEATFEEAIDAIEKAKEPLPCGHEARTPGRGGCDPSAVEIGSA